MKLKKLFYLLLVCGFLSLDVVAAKFDTLVVGTEIILSANDRPFTKPKGPGQDPRSIPMVTPFSAYLNDDSSIDLDFYQAIGEVEIVVSRNGEVIHSSSENVTSSIIKEISLPQGLSGQCLLEIKGENGAYAYGWFCLN